MFFKPFPLRIQRKNIILLHFVILYMKSLCVKIPEFLTIKKKKNYCFCSGPVTTNLSWIWSYEGNFSLKTKTGFSSYLFPSPNTEFLKKVIGLVPAYKSISSKSFVYEEIGEEIYCLSLSGLFYFHSDLFHCNGIYHVDKTDHGSENWKIFPVNLKQHLYMLLWHQHNTLKPQHLKRFIFWALTQPHSLCLWHSQFAACWWSNLIHSGSVIRMSV